MYTTAQVCLILLPLVALTSAFHHSGCNCGLGEGENVCADKHCTPLVVRPVEIPKPNVPVPPKVVCTSVPGHPQLPPIGGPCSCQRPIVTPAIVPKPPCLPCLSGHIDISGDHHLHLKQNHHVVYTGSESHPVATGNPVGYIPADPVSLSLAYKLAKESCNHNEDKLAYGFRTIPKDVPIIVRKKTNNIKEGNLYSLNGDVVELKKIACVKGKTLDEEAAEELLDLAEEEAQETVDNFRPVSLGELGYRLAKNKSPSFVDVAVVNPGYNPEPIHEKITVEDAPCDDGFQPGNVVVKHYPRHEHVKVPLPFPPPCHDQVAEGAELPTAAVYPSSYRYSTSSSYAASTANKHSKQVFWQKLGCN